MKGITKNKPFQILVVAASKDKLMKYYDLDEKKMEEIQLKLAEVKAERLVEGII